MLSEIKKQAYNGNAKIKNKSFSYILPLCGKNYSDFKFCKGVFVENELTPDLGNKIYLLYNTSYSLYNYQDEWLKEHNLFYDSFTIDDEHVIYVFDLPKGYEHIMELFKSGKYFEMDDEYKQHIIKFFSGHFNTENLKDVLYKSEKLYLEWEKKLNVNIPRTQNIASIPNIENETFNIRKIKEEEEWI